MVAILNRDNGKEAKIKNKVSVIKKSRFLTEGEIATKMEEMIKSAKKEILLITPWFYENKLKDLLIKAYNRDVIIKIIARRYKDGFDNIRHLYSLISLDQGGIQIEFIKNIHAKILITDNEEVLISSKNIVDSPAIDMGIWYSKSDEVGRARKAFYELYNQRFFEQYKINKFDM